MSGYESRYNNNNIINNEFKNSIINELILPSFHRDIKYIILTKTYWSTVSKICLTLSTILIGVSSIVSFSSSSYPNSYLNYYAGVIGVISIVMKEFASFANNQDHLKTIEVNDILKNIGIDITIPDESRLNNFDPEPNAISGKNPFFKNKSISNNSISNNSLKNNITFTDNDIINETTDINMNMDIDSSENNV
jgi:hypothetical protein